MMKRNLILVVIPILIFTVGVFADNHQQQPVIDDLFNNKVYGMQDLTGDDADQVIKKIKDFYDDLETINGEYQEEIYLEFIDQVQFMNGRFIFKKEKFFRLETMGKDKQIIVSDGDFLYTFLVKENMCYKHEVKTVDDINVIYEILPIGNFEKNFNVTVAENENYYLLELKLKEDPENNNLTKFTSIIYLLKKDTTLPDMGYLWSRDGRVLKFMFSGIEKNKQFKDSYFKLELPEEVEVIEQ